MFHAISDGKREPVTEIGVALIRFSGYLISAKLQGPFVSSPLSGGFFLPCVCSFAQFLVAVGFNQSQNLTMVKR